MTEAEKRELVRHVPLPEGMTRMESGPITFGNDWPGYFLRGDNAQSILSDATYLEYIVGQLEKGREVDTRPSTLFMARLALDRIKCLSQCVMVDDPEEASK